jgi:hypothetical protein
MCKPCHAEGKQVLYSLSLPAVLEEESTEHEFDLEKFKKVLATWVTVAAMHISFSQVEYESFRNLQHYFTKYPESFAYLPTSGTTIRTWIVEGFQRKKLKSKKSFF